MILFIRFKEKSLLGALPDVARRERPTFCRHGESALSGRVSPPGGPVKVRRTVETMGNVPALPGLHVLNSFACALGESALPFFDHETDPKAPSS